MQERVIEIDQNKFDNTVTIRIDGPAFPHNKFIRVVKALFSLLEEIDKGTSKDGITTLNWNVEAITKGSLCLKAKSTPTNGMVPFSRGKDVVAILGSGLELLRHDSAPPYGFSSRAMRDAKVFIEELDPDDIAHIDLSSKDWNFHFFHEIAKNLLEIPIQTYKFWGSVEGKLVNLDAEKKIKFGIRSQLQPNLIKVLVGDDEELYQKAINAMRKRVYVYGEIRQRFRGEKINIKAREIKVFPNDNEVPTSNDILKMLGI
jgi:hypothetical protein